MAKVYESNYMNKNTRDARLSSVANPLTKQSKRSELVDKAGDIEGGKHHVGQKGYAYQCKEYGVFIQVCVAIREYRASNPDSTFKKLWDEVLHEKWPYIFIKTSKDLYAGNIQRTIEAEPEWAKAYYTPAGDLIGMAKYRIERILENAETEDGTIIKAYDTLMKYDVQDQVATLAFSEETNETLSSIAQGLKELAAGDEE